MLMNSLEKNFRKGVEDNSWVHICFPTIGVNVLPLEFVESANLFICSYAHKVFHALDQLLI